MPWRRLKPPRHAILTGWGLPALVLLGAWIGSVIGNVPFPQLSRDLAAILVVPPYLGLLSNLGAVLWAAAAALALFTAAVLLGAGQRDDPVQFLVLFGLLTGLLMTDDLFMLHEWVFPIVLHLPPWLLLAFQAAVMTVLLLRYRGVYLAGNAFFLASALAAFAASVVIDFLPDDVLPGHYLFEDGLKFVGIANWLGFSAQISHRYLGPRAR